MTHAGPGNVIQNFQKSYWRCAGNWDNGSQHVHNFIPGNSTVEMTTRDQGRGGDAKIRSNGKYLNFVRVNCTNSETIGLTGDLKCHGFKIDSGNFNRGSNKFEITGDYQTIAPK